MAISSIRQIANVVFGGVTAVFVLLSPAFAGDAFSFVGPVDWQVGDPLSTAQEWDLFAGALNNQPEVQSVTNPVLIESPILSALSPGFLSSSANFYAFSGDYTVEATIPNHDANTPVGYGTLVRLQTAVTLNPDFNDGLLLNSVRLLDPNDDPNGTPLMGGMYAEACSVSLLYNGPSSIGGPFGDVLQDEWLVEFWLPDYVADFKLVMDIRVHGSFLAIRVDTLNVPEPFCRYPDLNCDCRTDYIDAETLSNNVAGPDVANVPPTGDAADFERADFDADLDVDMHDVANFQVFSN